MKLDQRVEERDRCNIAATLLIGCNHQPIPCIIEDLSERGARLRIDPRLALPDYFTLILSALGDISEHRSVQLRWQVGEVAGVRFFL